MSCIRLTESGFMVFELPETGINVPLPHILTNGMMRLFRIKPDSFRRDHLESIMFWKIPLDFQLINMNDQQKAG